MVCILEDGYIDIPAFGFFDSHGVQTVGRRSVVISFTNKNMHLGICGFGSLENRLARGINRKRSFIDISITKLLS